MELKIATWGRIEGGDMIPIYLESGYFLVAGVVLHRYYFESEEGRHHEVHKRRDRDMQRIIEFTSCLAPNLEHEFRRQGGVHRGDFVEPKEKLMSVRSH